MQFIAWFWPFIHIKNLRRKVIHFFKTGCINHGSKRLSVVYNERCSRNSAYIADEKKGVSNRTTLGKPDVGEHLKRHCRSTVKKKMLISIDSSFLGNNFQGLVIFLFIHFLWSWKNAIFANAQTALLTILLKSGR